MRWLALGCALWVSSISTLCHAQPPPAPGPGGPGASAPALSPEERARALTLADEGARLFDRGDFNGAREKFEQAEQIAPIPPFSFQRGRALEKLGRWVEAHALYEKVATAALAVDAPAPYIVAKRDAEKAMQALGPKLPRITVTTAGGLAAEVFFDGRSVGEAGPTARPADPGEHIIEARGQGGTLGRRTIQINAGETMSVELKLSSAPEPNVAAASKGPSLWTILGYVGMGVGGASLLVATATGIPAIVMKSDLEDACPNGRCPPSQFETLDTYDALRWTAGATLIGGLVIAGAGVTSFLLAPEQGIFGTSVKAEVGVSSFRLSVSFQ
ncbi:MAG: hypothetical protein HOW73_00110 [Polyangiaceae bacterium]|nr:hypothetical protein [Polyangiaceae bacterium]